MKIIVVQVQNVRHLSGIVRKIRSTPNWKVLVTGVSEDGKIALVISTPCHEASNAINFMSECSAIITDISSDDN